MPRISLGSEYVHRFIEPVLAAAMERTPVVIVEGARAVGKTSLVQEMLNQGVVRSYASLADPTTRAAAENNPAGWLASRPQPFVVDEAQLVADLPLALKALLDRQSDRTRCILTGSAAIGRTGLGGTDPLARRAQRFTLEPLSEAELHAPAAGSAGIPQSWSVIDALSQGEPDPSWTGDSSALLRDALQGGLPTYRLTNVGALADRRHSVRDDVSSMLTDTVLPDERWDLHVAVEVLDRVLRSPAAMMNVSRLASDIGITAPTVNRYLDILERRFLAVELPNLHRPTGRTSRSTAKHYPADIFLSAALLDPAGPDRWDDVTRGGVFEATVTQQLRAHLGWSAHGGQLTHWRTQIQGRTVEIDLVLETHDGTYIPIEVKSGSIVRPEHLKPLTAFREHFGSRVGPAYIINASDSAIAVAPDTWVLPLAALADPAAWLDSAPQPPAPPSPIPARTQPALAPEENETMTDSPLLPDARLFMSYSHADQNGAHTGDLRRFARALTEALRGRHDLDIEIFIDEENGTWGEDLWKRIETQQGSADFLLPFVSPNYLRSDACRREYRRIQALRDKNPDSTQILALRWIPWGARSGAEAPDILRDLDAHRYEDVSAAADADPDSSEYRRTLNRTAAKLAEAIEEMSQAQPSTQTSGGGTPQEQSDDRGVDDLLADVQARQPAVQAALEQFSASFESFGSAFGQVTTMPGRSANGASAAQLFQKAANELDPQAERLIADAKAAEDAWGEFAALTHRAVGQTAAIDPSLLPDELLSSIRQVPASIPVDGITQMRTIAQQMGMMSRALRPSSQALLASVSAFERILDGFRLIEDAWPTEPKLR